MKSLNTDEVERFKITWSEQTGGGYFSQSVTQSPVAINKKECQSLTINCVFKYRYSYQYFESGHFFRQTRPAAEWERISGGGRFVVSTDKAQKTFSLEIRDVRVEDTATYYCKALGWHTQRLNGALLCYYDDVDGSGTAVTVTAGFGSLVSRGPPLQTSAAGDTVTLSCEYSGICQYTVYWYCQSPGQPPKYMLQRHTSGEQNKENVAGGRISASLDATSKISWLVISQTQLSDSAVYYCALSRLTARTVIHSTERAGQKPEHAGNDRQSATDLGDSSKIPECGVITDTMIHSTEKDFK
ncbi:uncharacterized protein LOC132808247 [Hemiscyllium ocellatum]|uniref:uncharacterized protein LOC132808247 n=1 Tax=Hemiscyllium ocellatum TaxID=170820 RepID=UPI0029664846|nr:uncharacterized protein LOC132808247 [Hemiscyllium ocellatum]